MKIFIPLALLLQLGNAQASLIGIMDSGTDISHKDLAPKTWINPGEKVGNVDLDLNGLPGDVNGWDFVTGTAIPFDPQYNYLLDDDVKTFFLLASKVETQSISSAEYEWLETHSKDEKLMNKVDFVGGYIHGTHVAGISALNVPNAKILPYKILPTIYNEVKNKNSSSLGIVDTTIPTLTYAEFKKELLDTVAPQVEELTGLHSLMNFHKVDVVNESFGVGVNDAASFIQQAFLENVKRAPTQSELIELVLEYVGTLVNLGSSSFTIAPNTLFAIAAGNSTLDNDLYPAYPANVKADNKIVVAATIGYNRLAEFSNFGAKTVDIAAPGVAITATAPNNSYIPLSGTSQATPFVTNIIASIKDINPSITSKDIKTIVLGTVDVKSWLRERVRSSGIANKERAKKAAIYSKVMNITAAIQKARADVLDVVVDPALNKHGLISLDSFYRPVLPSLLKTPIK